MQTALLLLAFQDSFFKKKGSHSAKDVRKSAKAAAKMLEYFREQNLPVIHVMHMGKLENLSAEKLQTYQLLEPKKDELTLVTSQRNAFSDQKLEEILKSVEANHLVFAGLAAERHLLPTIQAAKSSNYSCTVAQDACAISKLKLGGEKIKPAIARQVVMAILNSDGVEITTTKAFTNAEEKKNKKLKKEAAKQEAAFEAAKAALEAAEANLKVVEAGLEDNSLPTQKPVKNRGRKAKGVASTHHANHEPLPSTADSKASASDDDALAQPNTRTSA